MTEDRPTPTGPGFVEITPEMVAAAREVLVSYDWHCGEEVTPWGVREALEAALNRALNRV